MAPMAPLCMLIWMSILAALIHVHNNAIFFIVEFLLLAAGSTEAGYLEKPSPNQFQRRFMWILSTVAFAVYFIMCALKMV